MSVTESGGSTAVVEPGGTDTLSIVLTGQPSSDVVVDLISDDPSSVTVSPATMTFTSANWGTPRPQR